MPRDTMNRQLHQLQDEVLILGSMVENAVSRSTDALERRDLQKAHQVVMDDRLINEKRFAIENAILIMIATQQPMAHDLRQLAAMLEIITELERIGDYAKGNARIAIRLINVDIFMPIHEIERMTVISMSMLHRALSAFIAEDSTLAYQIPQEDDSVDELYLVSYQKLVQAMIAKPEEIDNTNLMLWVTHNLERAADRVVNICERTVFSATGELLELATNDEDDHE